MFPVYTGKLCPSLRTGRPNFRIRLSSRWLLPRRLAEATIDLSGSTTGCIPDYRVGQQILDYGRRFAYLLLLFTELSPLDTAVLFSFVLSFSLSTFLPPLTPGITPLLRYYGGSVTSRAQFFGPSTDHERCSFPGS